MPTIYKYAVARRDLTEHYAYLAENASLGVADRFLVNAEESFTELSRHPMIGIPLRLSNLRLDGVRKWAVKNFDNYLIFYLPVVMGLRSCACCTLHKTGGPCSVYSGNHADPVQTPEKDKLHM